jgi:hypothetical protein
MAKENIDYIESNTMVTYPKKKKKKNLIPWSSPRGIFEGEVFDVELHRSHQHLSDFFAARLTK